VGYRDCFVAPLPAMTPQNHPDALLYFARLEIALSCHSERSEESLLTASPTKRFFTPLRSIQNDIACLWGVEKRSSCPWAV